MAFESQIGQRLDPLASYEIQDISVIPNEGFFSRQYSHRLIRVSMEVYEPHNENSFLDHHDSKVTKWEDTS